MTVSNNSDTKENQVKILLVGLDNSGKTSIFNCLKGIKNISAFNSLRPTRGAIWNDFEAMNTSYLIVDLGGQNAYRSEYFTDFSKYLAGTSKIIYVIDIQDTNRYDEALEYMNRVINLIDNKRDVDFSIFLHKYDSDFTFDNAVINKLIKKIRQVIRPNFVYSLHKTSIYAIFEKSTIA
ncbi:MAG: ADP-ribosylation factor-like protein [Promethearchaeota archaeon]